MAFVLLFVCCLLAYTEAQRVVLDNTQYDGLIAAITGSQQNDFVDSDTAITDQQIAACFVNFTDVSTVANKSVVFNTTRRALLALALKNCPPGSCKGSCGDYGEADLGPTYAFSTAKGIDALLDLARAQHCLSIASGRVWTIGNAHHQPYAEGSRTFNYEVHGMKMIMNSTDIPLARKPLDIVTMDSAMYAIYDAAFTRWSPPPCTGNEQIAVVDTSVIIMSDARYESYDENTCNNTTPDANVLAHCNSITYPKKGAPDILNMYFDNYMSIFGVGADAKMYYRTYKDSGLRLNIEELSGNDEEVLHDPKIFPSFLSDDVLPWINSVSIYPLMMVYHDKNGALTSPWALYDSFITWCAGDSQSGCEYIGKFYDHILTLTGCPLTLANCSDATPSTCGLCSDMPTTRLVGNARYFPSALGMLGYDILAATMNVTAGGDTVSLSGAAVFTFASNSFDHGAYKLYNSPPGLEIDLQKYTKFAIIPAFNTPPIVQTFENALNNFKTIYDEISNTWTLIQEIFADITEIKQWVGFFVE